MNLEKAEEQENKLSREHYRKGIMALEDKLKEVPGALTNREDFDKVNPLRHSFGDGCYIREIFMPAGQFITSKIHKYRHPFFVLQGDVSVLQEDGVKRIKAPYYGMTPAGTKRLLYIHEDTVWITVHVTGETDLEKIEQEIIAENFESLDDSMKMLESMGGGQ